MRSGSDVPEMQLNADGSIRFLDTTVRTMRSLPLATVSHPTLSQASESFLAFESTSGSASMCASLLTLCCLWPILALLQGKYQQSVLLFGLMGLFAGAWAQLDNDVLEVRTLHFD